MPPQGYSEDSTQDSKEIFALPAYALVIGVSEYDKFNKGFRKLNCAAKDANDFAEFLKNNGMIEQNIISLIDKDATIGRIRREFGNLRDNCDQAQPNRPLVFIYFAGHGMSTKNKRAYLIPYDGVRDDFDATTISNDEFELYVQNVHTDRLVVFLDACHGGAFVADTDADNTRGELPPYTYALPKLGEGKGRFWIASCGPDQLASEGEENGIFTEQLLAILEHGIADKSTPYITVANLYSELHKKVPAAAWQRKKRSQTPYGNLEGGTLQLAINTWQKNFIKQNNTNKRLFMDKIVQWFEANKPDESLRQLLFNYLQGKTEPGYERVYKVFDGEFDKTAGNVIEQRLATICNFLASAYQEAESLSNSPANKTAESPAFDQFTNVKVAPSKLGQAPPSQDQEPKRQLSAGDQKYVLEVIGTKPDLSNSWEGKLKDVLSRPISEAHLSTLTKSIAFLEQGGQPELPVEIGKLLIEVGTRFHEKWQNAPLGSHTPSTGDIYK